ncbi:MAG: glycosyltransferase family 4 protein [Alphaproteobacteria bacterium]
MKVVNILLNYKKSTHNNQVLGVERCFLDYSKNLVLKGVEVVSVMKSKIFLVEEAKKTNSKVYELPAFNQGDIYSIIKLAWLFFSFSPNLVICHSGRALLFSRIARILVFKKIPIVVVDHGINPLKFINADYVMTVNSHFSKELVKAGKPLDRALVIPNMIEIPENFQPLIKENFPKKIRLGSLGRLSFEKNFDKVIRAMAILKSQNIDCEYVIGGVGIEKDNLEKLAVDLKLENNFKILGWVENKREFFSNIDIFILPSLGETFGIVLLEAMLYSTPIISANSWGPDEIITDRFNGLKINKDDSQFVNLIAQAIIELRDDQDLARTIANNAYRDLLQKYTSQVVSKKLYEICQQISKKNI